MTAALTPLIALAYLRELSTDVRAAVVLDGDGELLAGDPAIVPAARALLAAWGAAPAAPPAPAAPAPAAASPTTPLAVRTSAGVALATRAQRHAIVVAAGIHALVPLLLHDLQGLLTDLGDPPGRSDRQTWTESSHVADSVVRAAEALLDAAGRRD